MKTNFFIFHPFESKKDGVIVQNGAHTLKIYIWSVYNMTMESTLMSLDAYHDSTLRHLRDVGRVTPTTCSCLAYGRSST
jgi:hypothetical protein